jgi:hypothetical protein
MLAVGLCGYRLGIQGGSGEDGVFAGALISRAAPRRVPTSERMQPAFATANRQSTALAIVTPPEASMQPMRSWELREPAPESTVPLQQPGIQVRALPPATPGVETVPNPLEVAAKPRGESREMTATPSAPQGASPLVSGSLMPPANGQAVERVEATASAHLADALQASIEEVSRRQVTEEIALLAQALKQAATRPAESGEDP